MVDPRRRHERPAVSGALIQKEDERIFAHVEFFSLSFSSSRNNPPPRRGGRGLGEFLFFPPIPDHVRRLTGKPSGGGNEWPRLARHCLDGAHVGGRLLDQAVVGEKV